ncbi:EAL domain-containing protein [Treponema parvum]|uniref:EAL domain-containing protein n=1 Tax=Treponema parvum TaxID=138851 RepID=A0A975IDX5_9SPIR|nr:GGDEF domain-containing phosphodiesterase [Treponema parvum]QTQ12674.1 EAL domain-containing protein [Treponema parvum]
MEIVNNEPYNKDFLLARISLAVLIFFAHYIFFMQLNGAAAQELLNNGRIQFVFSFFSASSLFLTFIFCFVILNFRCRGFVFIQILNGIPFLFALAILIKYNIFVLPGILNPLAAAVFLFFIYYRQRNLLCQFNKSKIEMEQLLYTDELTGLASRRKISDTLKNMTDPQASVSPFSIMFIDLDNFKVINDTLGHKIGDIFLQEAVHNISCHVEPDMLLGRMGGDEFLLIISGSKTDEELLSIAEKIEIGITRPFVYKNKNYSVTCSIGIARFPEHAQNDSEILRYADMALYEAKKRGKNRSVIFNSTLRKSIALETDIHYTLEDLDSGIMPLQDLDEDENQKISTFSLLFQPQFNTDTKELRGFEVLSYFTSKDFGYIRPSVFIPIMERNGDIITFGKWVLRESINQYLKIIKDMYNSPLLSVNISAVQFEHPLFIENLASIMKETGMPPDKLEIEVTESIAINSFDSVIEKLTAIHNMGIQIALDDFGTGYSSFNYLRLLPLDLLKIDKSFIDPIPHDKSGVNIVKAIIDMSHRLGIEVIAEGVETDKQFDLLKELGCDSIQGFYLAKSLPSQAL